MCGATLWCGDRANAQGVGTSRGEAPICQTVADLQAGLCQREYPGYRATILDGNAVDAPDRCSGATPGGSDEVLCVYLDDKWIELQQGGGGGGTPGGTDGQVQVNAAGSFGGISEGTSGQVLTSAGAGAAPTFEDLPAAGQPGFLTPTGAWTQAAAGDCLEYDFTDTTSPERIQIARFSVATNLYPDTVATGTGARVQLDICDASTAGTCVSIPWDTNGDGQPDESVLDGFSDKRRGVLHHGLDDWISFTVLAETPATTARLSLCAH